MLGRDISTVRARGATEFGESHARDDAEAVLVASDLEVRNRLRGVGLRVRPGEVVGLAGLLGSGRSETVKALYGALPLRRGSVSVQGRPVRSGSVRDALRAGIALLSEDRKAEGIIPDLSVRDNIALAVLPRLSRFGVVSDAKVDALVDTYMRRLRIKAASPAQKVRELSGGNQQKVLIARWLSTEPKVFLLDEPTRGIDVGAKREVQALIDELAGHGLAVVLISSEMEELTEGSDRVVVLHDGGVQGELRGDDLSNSGLLHAMAGDLDRAGDLARAGDRDGDGAGPGGAALTGNTTLRDQEMKRD
jgi:ribose transport system ATP-binding protein